MKVAAINNNPNYQNYAVPQFEGKKEKPSNSVKTTLKAVPLAVLIAMSPLNTVKAQQQEEKTVLSLQYNNATTSSYLTNNHACDINFISNDGNDENAERVMLHFWKEGASTKYRTEDDKVVDAKYNRSTQIYVTKLISQITRSDDERNILLNERYFVEGPSVELSSPLVLPDGSIVGEVSREKNPDRKIVITKDLYNYLKEVMGDEVENVIQEGEMPEDMYDLLFEGEEFF